MSLVTPTILHTSRIIFIFIYQPFLKTKLLLRYRAGYFYELTACTARCVQAYEDSDDIMSMMDDYTEYMQKLADYSEKLDAYDEDDMSDADLSYYLEVTNRCNQKLLEVA